MADEEPKYEKGGATTDSRKAADRLAAAIEANDPGEIKEAIFDQNAALINMSMTTVIPTLKNVLETVLRSEVGQIYTRLDNHNRAELDWRAEERTTRDAQADYLYKELDGFRAGQEAITAALEATATEIKKEIGDLGTTVHALVGDVSDLKEATADHGEQLAAYDIRFTAIETRLAVNETQIAAVAAEQVLLRRLVTQMTHDKAELKRLREEHGGEE